MLLPYRGTCDGLGSPFVLGCGRPQSHPASSSWGAAQQPRRRAPDGSAIPGSLLRGPL